MKRSYSKIIEGFNSSDLAQDEWTHEAHLMMAVHYVIKHLPQNILPVIRKKIKKLNEFHGTPNTFDSGYHESITIFWLYNAFVFCTKNKDLNEEELINEFISNKEGDKSYPLNFYSKKVLFSTEARHRYIMPDLNELDVALPQTIVHHGHLLDNQFVDLFESCELDPSLFSHEAHLRLAWIYINKFESSVAEKKVCTAIQNFVAHVGSQDKYHHTLTMAAVKTVYHFYQKYDTENFFDFISEFPKVKKDFKSLIDSHYSPELIQSSSARSIFLEPDLLEYS